MINILDISYCFVFFINGNVVVATNAQIIVYMNGFLVLIAVKINLTKVVHFSWVIVTESGKKEPFIPEPFTPNQF